MECSPRVRPWANKAAPFAVRVAGARGRDAGMSREAGRGRAPFVTLQ